MVFLGGDECRTQRLRGSPLLESKQGLTPTEELGPDKRVYERACNVCAGDQLACTWSIACEVERGAGEPTMRPR